MSPITITAPLIFSGVTFFTLFFLVFLGNKVLRESNKKRLMEERIRSVTNNQDMPYTDVTAVESEKTPQGRILWFLHMLGKRMTSDVSPKESLKYTAMRINFLKAGLRNPNAPAVLWGTKCLLAVALPIVFIVLRLSLFKIASGNLSMLITIFLALAGFYLPDIWLKNKAQRRKKQITNGLPDALDLLVVCVEAGVGLDASIFRVAEEISMAHKELSEELKLYNLEMKAGKLRQEALKNLAVRIDIEDVKNLTTLLIQADKFGTGVTQALRVFSESFRTARQQRAEETAAKMPVKLIMALILFIFPAIFVVILGPAVIRIFQVLIKS